MTAGCDHKFVDSTSCIKCGWMPPLLNIVRVETEPPDYQADVIMGVGYFRMPSEEAMSDDLQASKAWQDVEQLVINTSVRTSTGRKTWAAIEQARAADVQQIAALQDSIEQVQMSAEIADANAVAARRGLQDAEQQIAALRAERDTMDVAHANLCAELAALRAENEQIQKDRQQLIQMVTQAQQLNTELERRIGIAGEVIREVNHADVAVRLRADAAEATLAQWETWGIIEIAIRNVNVASYMNEWEHRALAAEAHVTALQAENEKLQRTVDRQAATLADHANAYQRIMQLEAQLDALTAPPEKP